MANSRDADFQKVKYTTKKKLSNIDADNNCFLVMNVFIVNAFLTIITLTTFTLQITMTIIIIHYCYRSPPPLHVSSLPTSSYI